MEMKEAGGRWVHLMINYARNHKHTAVHNFIYFLYDRVQDFLQSKLQGVEHI